MIMLKHAWKESEGGANIKLGAELVLIKYLVVKVVFQGGFKLIASHHQVSPFHSAHAPKQNGSLQDLNNEPQRNKVPPPTLCDTIGVRHSFLSMYLWDFTASSFALIDSSNKGFQCSAPPVGWFLDQEVSYFQWSVALSPSSPPSFSPFFLPPLSPSPSPSRRLPPAADHQHARTASSSPSSGALSWIRSKSLKVKQPPLVRLAIRLREWQRLRQNKSSPQARRFLQPNVQSLSFHKKKKKGTVPPPYELRHKHSHWENASSILMNTHRPPEISSQWEHGESYSFSPLLSQSGERKEREEEEEKEG